MLSAFAACRTVLRYAQPLKGEARRTGADLSKAGSLLGYQPVHTLREGLKSQIEWLRGLASAF
jgi:nucleoside-diphosphate-sugar epimerase